MAEQTQAAAHNGFSPILQSWGDLNTAWIAIGFELTCYSVHLFNNTAAALKQVAFASTIKDKVEIQSEYAKKMYYDHLAELSNLCQMCVRVVDARGREREVENSLPGRAILMRLVNLKWGNSSVVCRSAA
jgi:hypothetical protein